ncbi:hypothetical protein X756_32810 [Mesorhizobium sp. LSHC412B00]|nr:hypothetical protein X756_32810 [Mesorhizobium sp. LSHC412B00]
MAVGVDEIITGHVEITEVRPDSRSAKLRPLVGDEAGDVCLTGTATVFTIWLADGLMRHLSALAATFAAMLFISYAHRQTFVHLGRRWAVSRFEGGGRHRCPLRW